jgi:hypothetical protein
MLGLELLPLLVTRLVGGLDRGQLGLLGRGQHGIDLGADGSTLLHASDGGGAFSLGEAGGSGLVARGVGSQRFKGFALLVQGLTLRLVLGEGGLHDLLDAGLLGVAQVELAHGSERSTVMATTAVRTTILCSSDGERSESHGRSERQGESDVLAHGGIPFRWVDLLVSI